MEFEEIKIALQQYNRSSIIKLVLVKLKFIQLNTETRYPFWTLLILIKWSYLHTDDDNRKKMITQPELEELEKKIGKFEGEFTANILSGPEEVHKFFRIIAYQQFSLQEECSNPDIDRQIVLYTELPSSVSIEEEFYKLTRISLVSFLSYCYLTYVALNIQHLNGRSGYDGVLGEDFNHYFHKQYSAEELRKFLFLLSAKRPGDFNGLHKLKDERLQLFETNFFLTKPFLRFKGRYHLPYRTIFNETFKCFVYTYMKAKMPDSFPEEFGKRMEKYIELGIRELKISYQTENELKKNYPIAKVADFRIQSDILIECKAIELHPRSGVLRVPNILTKEFNSSVIKAYCQLLATANAVDPAMTWWGIIVTYREMYLGFGNDAWDEFLKEPVERFVKTEGIDIAILPPANLFFIPLDDWDHLIQVVKEGKASFSGVLTKGRELNTSSNAAEKRILMSQVLNECFNVKKIDLSFLQKAHEKIDVLSKALLFE